MNSDEQRHQSNIKPQAMGQMTGHIIMLCDQNEFASVDCTTVMNHVTKYTMPLDNAAVYKKEVTL